MSRPIHLVALLLLSFAIPTAAADGPVCAAAEESEKSWSELFPSQPGTWRQALKAQPAPIRSGEEPMGPKSDRFRPDITEGRWLPGYRPVTPVAFMEFEAWKALRQSGLAEASMVPSAANSHYGTNLLNGARATTPPVEAIEHIVRETTYPVSTVEPTELDLGARDGDVAPKKGGPKGDYHHGSGLTWNDYLLVKQLAESSPTTPDAQEATRQTGRAPATAGVAFDAIQSDFSSVPPDPIMAAGPSHLVAIVNRAYQVYDKTGAALTARIDLDTFFSGVTNCDGVFDVYVDYDEANDRFVMGGMNVMEVAGTTTYLCLAASATNDPTGAWHRAGFRGDENSTSEWVDFPHMAIGLDEIYITANMFDDAATSFSHTRIFAVDRDALYAGNPITVAEASLGTIFFTAMPGKLSGFTSGGWPAPGTPQHFISHDAGGNSRIWRWADPFNQAPVVYGDVVEVAFGGVPPNATELGGGFPQDSGSAKWLDAEYRDGRLYATRNVACDFAGGSSESCLDWIQIDVSGPAPVLEQQQTGGAYGTADEYRYYPDLAVDRNGNIAIGYTKSGDAEYSSVYVTGREFGDAAGTLQAETVQRAGLGNYTDNGSGCLGNCDRWGDYTGMATDPDGCTFWYLGQYSDGGSFNWGTHIGSFRFPSCSVDSTLQVSKGSVTCNDSLTITVTDSTALDAATVSAQTTVTTTGGDSETVPPGSWVGSDCSGPDCTTWMTTLAVSDAAGTNNDGTINTSDGETITALYVDPHGGHENQSRNVATTCTTWLDDGGYLLAGGCEGGAGTESYREYIDGGEYIAYTFGVFNPLTAPALSDVEATLSVSGPAAGLVTIYNPTVHIGPLDPGQLGGPVFHLYVDPAIDAAGLRLSQHDFDLSLTSTADGFTSAQVLTQVQLLQGDDNIVRESECWNFEAGTEGFVNDRYVNDYTCQFSDGCPTTTFVSTVEAPWTHGAGCGSETRTDHPDMACDVGGSNAFMSNADGATCGGFAQADDQLTDDVLYSPIFGPANSGNAANGQPWFFDWQYAEWFYRADMISGTDVAMQVAYFWDDDYLGVAAPAFNEVDSLYSFFLGYLAYANQDWDSGNAWDPADPPRNIDGTSFGGAPKLATSGLQWRWAVEVFDADIGGWPQETPATSGLSLDNMQFVYDQYHAEEQFGTCSTPESVVAFDRYAYLECPGDNVGIGVLAPGAGGSVRVTVTSAGGGDSETILIVGPGPYYSTTLPYSTGAGPSVNDGTLLVVPSDLLTLTYLDDPSTGSAFAFLECEGGDVVSEGVAALADNGDGDDFADRNETVDLSLRIRNNTLQDLVNTVVTIATDDPTIDCVTKASASFGTVTANGGTATNDLVTDPFTFKVADQAECADPTAPPTATFKVFISADGFNGASQAQQFTLILDLNDLPGTITFWENFSTDPAGFTHEVGPGDEDRIAVDIGGLTCSPYVDDWFWNASGGVNDGGYFLWQDPADTFPNGTYSDLNDAVLYSPVLKVGASSTTLTFDHEYLLAWTGTFRLDGVRVDYQVNGGAWQKLQSLPYDGSLIWNAYCNPLCNGNEFFYPCFTENAEEGELVFNQFDQGTVNWTSAQGDITGLTTGDLVRLRWRFGSMNSAVYGVSTQGGYGLDNVRLTNVIEQECDSAVNPDDGCGVVFDSAGNLVEVCGDGDLLIEPTETWSVDVTLRNSSASDAVNTTADLATALATPQAASISSPTAAFGTILASGSTATASYEFGVDAGAVCIDDVVFDVENIVDNATTHSDKPSAFSVEIGGPGAQEVVTQATDPLSAANGIVVSDLTPSTATVGPVDSALLTFGTTYTNVMPAEVATQDTDPLIAENNSVTSTLSAPVTIDPNDAVAVTLDWTSLTHEKVFECTRVYIRTPTGATLTLKGFDEAVANPYDLLSIYQNANGGPGQYQIGLQEEASGPCKMDAQLAGVTMTVTEPPTVGSWTGNVQVSLWDGNSYSVVKQFGAADAQPYDVTSIYNAAGPGTYKLRLREAGGGGTAELDSAVLTVIDIECDLGCSTFVAPAPPVADDVAGTGLRLAKGAAPDEILFTFDNATCSSDHAVVLYGNFGDYSGYAGAVDGGCNAGSGPVATVTHSGDNVWFIVHWVNQDGEAGSAGSSTTGPRGWPAAGLCGVVADDASDGVCD